MYNCKVIVRTRHAGVFYGEIRDRDGDKVVMANTRCIWYSGWRGEPDAVLRSGRYV